MTRKRPSLTLPSSDWPVSGRSEAQFSLKTWSVDSPRQLVVYSWPSCRNKYLGDSYRKSVHLPLPGAGERWEEMPKSPGPTSRGSDRVTSSKNTASAQARGRQSACTNARRLNMFPFFEIQFRSAWSHSYPIRSSSPMLDRLLRYSRIFPRVAPDRPVA